MPDSDPEIEALIQNYQRNRDAAKRGTYSTRLAPRDELNFQAWIWKNKIPFDLHWPPDQSMQDYDMRGYWKALQSGDPIAVQSTENQHFPDKWKTPYHKTFSNQSMYASPDAPRWDGTRLLDKNGNVIFVEPGQ